MTNLDSYNHKIVVCINAEHGIESMDGKSRQCNSGGCKKCSSRKEFSILPIDKSFDTENIKNTIDLLFEKLGKLGETDNGFY